MSDVATHQQMVLLAEVMAEQDVLLEQQAREGIKLVHIEEDEEIELVGGAASELKTLRGSRALVKEQMEIERIKRSDPQPGLCGVYR